MSEALIALLALNLALDIVLLRRVSVVRAKFDALHPTMRGFVNDLLAIISRLTKERT